MKTKLVGLQD